MPDCSGEPVVTTSCASYILHARLRVQRAPGIPCALSIRAVDAKLGRIAPRERRGVCLDWLFEISRRPGRGSSWPGLSRPSTCFGAASKDVDTRHKAGHDGVEGVVTRSLSTRVGSLPCSVMAGRGDEASRRRPGHPRALVPRARTWMSGT